MHPCLRFEPLTTTDLFTGPVILPFPEGQRKVKVARLRLTLCDPMDYTGHEFSRPGYWSGWPFPSLGDLANPGITPRSPALQADSLPAEPPGKPKNPGVGSLSLLQRIFLSQKSNQDLLHCRWILYHLSYARSPAMPLGSVCRNCSSILGQ